MQITQNNNSPKFNGSFLINYKKAIPEMREAFELAVGKPKVQVFDSFNGKENYVMYVMKDSKDYDAASFILKNQLNFRYYPEVSTKLQFSSDFPEEVSSYIKTNKPKLIQKPFELKEYVDKFREFCRQKRDSHLSFQDRILASLKYDRNVCEKTKTSNSVVAFMDKDSGNKIIMSPKNQNGTCFVMINPKNSYDSIKRYAFDTQGNLLATFEPPNGIKLFDKKFKEAIAYQCSDKK